MLDRQWSVEWILPAAQRQKIYDMGAATRQARAESAVPGNGKGENQLVKPQYGTGFFGKQEKENSLVNLEDNVTMKTGALSGALTSKNDPDYKKRDAFAELYYAEVLGRKREYEIAAVAKNSGFREEDVSKIFAHVFELEHLFLDGSVHKFDMDYDMAQSWIRLREGKNIQEHDLILLKHELMEAEIMGTGTTVQYESTHEKVSQIYNYKAALLKYLKEKNLE